MPNWVYNTISVKGSEVEVEKFLDYAGKPSPFTPGEERAFNFHSFVTPPEDKVEEYNTVNGFVGGLESGNTEFNWYRWNNANWNTKWNACEVNVDRGMGEWSQIQFQTAWDAPKPVFYAMAEKFPHLSFYIDYEEEQGWGGKYSFENGELLSSVEWDIPESHEDYISRGRTCACEWDDDRLAWYKDCPRTVEEKKSVDKDGKHSCNCPKCDK